MAGIISYKPVPWQVGGMRRDARRLRVEAVFAAIWYNVRWTCWGSSRKSTTKGALRWRANVGIAAVRATATAASTDRTRSTSTVTTKSTASGAAAQATGTVAYIPPTRYIGTAPAGTSASGAARRRMAPAAYIRRRVATRSSVSRPTGADFAATRRSELNSAGWAGCGPAADQKKGKE